MNGSTTNLWVYKDQINPVAELYPSGNVKYHFTYAEQGHVPSLMRHYDEAGNLLNTYRYVTDHLGSVLMLIDIESNAIAQEIEYDAWGNLLSDSNPGFQPFYYVGGIYDQITKLTKFGYRDYQAETGRFVQSDPIGLDGGWNVYGYVDADPILSFDIFGLSKTKDPRRGNDPVLNDLKEAARRADRGAIDQIEQAVKDGEYGEISKQRSRLIRGWCKLAKDGRLLRMGAAVSVFDAFKPSAQRACEIDPSYEEC